MLPAVDALPASQLVHDDTAVVFEEYCPATQRMQPWPAVMLPAGHELTHTELPAIETLPRSQIEHDVIPALEANVPASHGK